VIKILKWGVGTAVEIVIFLCAMSVKSSGSSMLALRHPEEYY